MSLIHQTLTPASLAARRQNARKSTGPRTPEGKRRVALSFSFLAASGRSLRRSMRALGESPRRFKRLVGELVASHQPATPSEMMLVEDLAALRWQRLRCERARLGRLAWQREQLERVQLRREVEENRALDFDPDALRARGLRAAPESEANYIELINLVERIEEELEKGDFATLLPGLLMTLYGEQPAGRGAALQALVADLNKPGAPRHILEQSEAALRIGLAQESHAVLREYVAFSRQRKDLTSLLRESSLAPAGDDLQQLAREEAAIDRQIERKIRLLAVMQKARRAAAEPPAANPAVAETAALGPELAGDSHVAENAGKEEN
jgi:hypothetical protein